MGREFTYYVTSYDSWSDCQLNKYFFNIYLHKNAHKFDWKLRAKLPVTTPGYSMVNLPLLKMLSQNFWVIFFVKNTSKWACPGYVLTESMDEWVSEWEMYVCHSNQIGPTITANQNSYFKVNGMWKDLIPIQLRMAIFNFFYKRGESIHILGLLQHFLWVMLRILRVGLIIICNCIISQRYICLTYN